MSGIGFPLFLSRFRFQGFASSIQHGSYKYIKLNLEQGFALL